MEKVIWKDIKGYEGFYQVSTHGQVRSLDRIIIRSDGFPVSLKGQVLAQTTDKDGYKHLRLRKNNAEKSFFVHRLVADTFVLNFEEESVQVNHKDEDKANNHYSNLEWCTAAYNVNYGTRNQRVSKPVIAFNQTETLYFDSIVSTAQHGFSPSLVSKAVTGVNKSHKGYQWKRAN